MRKYAVLQVPVNISLCGDSFMVRKVLYYKSELSNYSTIYVYDTDRDTFGVRFPSISEPISSTEIEQKCAENFGIEPSDWIQIEDPPEYCNLDFIVPTRRKGRNDGIYPGDGLYEQYLNGIWIEIHEKEL